MPATKTPKLDHIEEAVAGGALSRDPHGIYRELRERSPLYWSECLGQWLVTSAELVEEVLLAPNLFSNFGYDTRYIGRLGERDLASVPTLNHHFHQRGLVQSDPPEHTRLRRAISAFFTKGAVSPLEETIRTTVSGLLDAAGPDFDLIRDLAGPLPVFVIADLLGVPDEDRGKFPAWSADTVKFFGTPAPDPHNAAQLEGSLVEWRGLLSRLFAERLADPRDDLLSKFAALIKAGQISTEEALSTGIHLLIAGHETTTNLVGNTMYCLFTHPGQMAAVLESPEHVIGAIEETLRFEPPIQRIRRTATEECELHGYTILPGEPVIPVLSSANRDPSRFDRPDEYDVRRDFSGRQHIAFGRGVHVCLGAPLARLEAPIAVGAVLDRLPKARLPHGFEPQWRPTINLRGIVSLPIESPVLDPSAP